MNLPTEECIIVDRTVVSSLRSGQLEGLEPQPIAFLLDNRSSNPISMKGECAVDPGPCQDARTGDRGAGTFSSEGDRRVAFP